ncbi:uncharacterized protein LOC129216417 [Uloborus diversus]|uniref:uncharacterized protein LOC129216417 n=1 Tax=Uloborus diversus TaxID=327109 RepID=UPI002409C739|nr:uncharacterized protein LOC129216417 [Uloborus diversus]
MWNLDVIGITDPIIKKGKEEKDLQMEMQFQNSVFINNEGRYEVALPWAEDRLPLPTNKELPLKHLETTTRKLCSQNLINRDDEVLKNWEDSGIIEEVKQSKNIDSGHYLPHRLVIKESSSTPVRPVFDASARTKFSPSLNQCLEAGPNLIELIPSLLLRFRENKYGVVADIEKVFYRLALGHQIENTLNFSVLDYHIQNCMKNTEHDQKVVEKLRHSFYVDNVLSSFESEAELQNFIEESRNIMAQAKYNLRSDVARLVEIWNILGCRSRRKHEKKFLHWFEDLCLLKEVSIPLWVQCHEKNKKSCSIHTFFDASGRTYAATVFLRIQTDTEVEVYLLASKSRVAPAKQITMPRLELIAATVGARLCTSVLESLQWQNVELTFWTESTVVLSWIQKEEIWTVFVDNRVREIRKLTKPNSWKFVKRVENSADLPSAAQLNNCWR